MWLCTFKVSKKPIVLNLKFKFGQNTFFLHFAHNCPPPSPDLILSTSLIVFCCCRNVETRPKWSGGANINRSSSADSAKLAQLNMGENPPSVQWTRGHMWRRHKSKLVRMGKRKKGTGDPDRDAPSSLFILSATNPIR